MYFDFRLYSNPIDKLFLDYTSDSKLYSDAYFKGEFKEITRSVDKCHSFILMIYVSIYYNNNFRCWLKLEKDIAFVNIAMLSNEISVSTKILRYDIMGKIGIIGRG